MPNIKGFPITHDLYTIDGIIFVVILFVFIIKAYQRHRKKAKLAQSGIQDIDRMKGRVFEEYLAVVFRKKGFSVQLTRASKDQGGDLVLTKGGTRIVVQAKRWKSNVSNKAVQEVVAAKPFYKADQAMIVTNSFYTKSAIELAKANQVELWDRNRLITELVYADAKNTANTTDPEQKLCPDCGAPLVLRHRHTDHHVFYGCSAYPTCKYVENK